MPRGGSGLAYLVQMCEKGEDSLAFATEVDEGFAAAELGAGVTQEIQDERFGLFGMALAVGFLLGPPGSGDE